jgi:hypothetical protein
MARRRPTGRNKPDGGRDGSNSKLQGLLDWMLRQGRMFTGNATQKDVGLSPYGKGPAAPFMDAPRQVFNNQMGLYNDVSRQALNLAVPYDETLRAIQGQSKPDDALWAGLYATPLLRGAKGANNVRKILTRGDLARWLGGQSGLSRPDNEEAIWQALIMSLPPEDRP